MTNVFDDDDSFHVLRNRVGEFSFWPAHAAVPDGWEVALASASRPDAEGYVREHWTTLTPAHRVRPHGVRPHGVRPHGVRPHGADGSR